MGGARFPPYRSPRSQGVAISLASDRYTCELGLRRYATARQRLGVVACRSQGAPEGNHLTLRRSGNWRSAANPTDIGEDQASARRQAGVQLAYSLLSVLQSNRRP